MDRVFQKAYTKLNEGGKFDFNVHHLLKNISEFLKSIAKKHMLESDFGRDNTNIQLPNSKYNFEQTYMELRSNMHVFLMHLV